MVIDAVWLFYNYIRTHMGLGYITPAEKTGMSIMVAVHLKRVSRTSSSTHHAGSSVRLILT